MRRVCRSTDIRAGFVQWYETIFELIDLRSFSNLWYWIALAVMWSSASHWVIGVPYDLVTRVRRQGYGAQAALDLEHLVQINVRRLLYIAEISGLWLVGSVCFILTVLLLLGFVYNVEFAQAVFLLAFPMTLVSAITLRAAHRIEGARPDVTVLCKWLLWHRMKIQGIGMVSIFVTAMWGMWQNMHLGAF